VPGRPLDPCYKEENVGWVEKGTENLIHHINTVKKAGINPVVCINNFHTDTEAEIKAIRRLAEKAGARVALSKHWLKGGDGALELADAVIDACNQPNNFKFLYELNVPLRTRIEMIAEQVYGADGVDFTPEALAKVKALESDPDISKMGTCMVKTHLSITDNPNLKGVPKNWRLRIKDVLTFRGAGFVVPMAGDIKLMPGTSSDPAFRRVDVDVTTGKVKGVF
jgi:formate--tetrahydrofolate ligase